MSFSIDEKLYQNPARRILVLEGIPGAGKTTLSHALLEYLKEKGIRCTLFPEVVDKQLLALFLNDRAKYGFAFELYLLSERISTMKQAHDFITHGGGIAIVDRGPVGGCAFAHYSDSHNKTFDLEARQVYDRLLINGAPWKSMKIAQIYFPVKPKTALKRIFKRGNESEIQAYDEKFMVDIDEAHKLCFNLIGDEIGRQFIWPRTIHKKTQIQDCKDILLLLCDQKKQ